MQKYDGMSDLRNHLATFTMDTLPYQHNNGLTIYLFFKSLEGEALRWFNTLTSSDLSDFKIILEKFQHQYSHRIQHKPTIGDLLAEKMKPDEEFVTFASRWRDMAAVDTLFWYSPHCSETPLHHIMLSSLLELIFST